MTTNRRATAGQADIRLTTTDTGLYVVTIAYASTGQVVHTWTTDRYHDAETGYLRRVCLFGRGLTIANALDIMEGQASTQTAPAPTAEVVSAPTAPTTSRQPRMIPTGTHTTMTADEARVVHYAVNHLDGRIGRGRGVGCLDIRQLLALARRGFVELTGTTVRPAGAMVLPWGARRAAELASA